jgi:hypothetical protein
MPIALYIIYFSSTSKMEKREKGGKAKGERQRVKSNTLST